MRVGSGEPHRPGADDLLLLELGDVLLVESDLPQDLVVVLAERRCGPAEHRSRIGRGIAEKVIGSDS
jgi:hypothetical protein